MATCVYWEDHREASDGEMRWSTKGCWISFANENYTVCSCSHLSTFALIMQIAEVKDAGPPACCQDNNVCFYIPEYRCPLSPQPAPANPFLDWLNRVCVIVGLFFFGLAIFTFLLCSWNPKINNTARLHLCLNLSMSHLLLLWNENYVENKVRLGGPQPSGVGLRGDARLSFSAAGLQSHGGSAPLLSHRELCVDAAGSAAAPPLSSKTQQSPGHSEGWPPQATALSDWLRRAVYHCWRLCAGVF